MQNIAIVDFKATGYSEETTPVNTTGSQYHTRQIQILDLYRHAIANSSAKLFTSENLDKYGWNALYRYGIEKNIRRVDDIFALSGIKHPSFLSYAELFSSKELKGIFEQSIDIERFLRNLRMSLIRYGEIAKEGGMRLVKNPLAVEDISDSTRENSFHVGMIFARLYAEKVFSIPFLTHVQELIDAGAAEIVNGLAPDLAGQDMNAKWHVLEAKGTTESSYLYNGLKKAKKQLASLRIVNTSNHVTQSACGTLYTFDRVRTLLRDPVPTGEGVLTLDWMKSVLNHYKLYLNAEAHEFYNPRNRNRDYVMLTGPIRISGRLRVRYSIHKRILALIAKVGQLDQDYPLLQTPLDINMKLNGQLRKNILERNEHSATLKKEYAEIIREIHASIADMNENLNRRSTGIDGLRLEV